MMSSPNVSKMKRIFAGAMALPLEQRRAYLQATCADDPEMLQELEALLSSDSDWVAYLEGSPLGNLEAETWIQRRIGKYQVVECIGSGGMGTVFRAERADGAYSQSVAIKVLDIGFRLHQLLLRFEQERQIIAHFNHPNIAKLLDGGTTEDGRPYFVMEYVAGQRIDQYCREHDLIFSERMRLFQEVCRSVGVAHQNLIVHCDLKPSNILVAEDGVPKLLDFGIAKILDPNKSDPSTLTRIAGRGMTPEYASPEQITGHAITTSSDIYALGILLFELTTGQRPYELENHAFDTLHRVICLVLLCHLGTECPESEPFWGVLKPRQRML